jgi:hypothetical protein
VIVRSRLTGLAGSRGRRILLTDWLSKSVADQYFGSQTAQFVLLRSEVLNAFPV